MMLSLGQMFDYELSLVQQSDVGLRSREICYHVLSFCWLLYYEGSLEQNISEVQDRIFSYLFQFYEQNPTVFSSS